MELVFFLKPMVDMMYKLQILDYLLVFICLICLLKKCKMILNRMDIAILILMGLFAFSFLRNTNGLSQFFKIESGFLLYFIGRNYYCHVNKYIHIIRIGFIPVMLVTMITFVTGSGFQMWGNINTFSGLYFFKTDLAVAMAVISSMTNKPLPADMVVFGEIGLSGEIRAVSQPNLRLKEAQKLGFTNAIIPNNFSKDKKTRTISNMSYHEIGNVQRLISRFS